MKNAKLDVAEPVNTIDEILIEMFTEAITVISSRDPSRETDLERQSAEDLEKYLRNIIKMPGEEGARYRMSSYVVMQEGLNLRD